MTEKILNFTQGSLAEALDKVRCLSDLGPELIAEQVFAALAQQPAPMAVVDANDDGMWADILPDVSVKVGDLLYAAPPATEQPYSTTSDKCRAELYDEVWKQARLIGYGNVTEALADLERRKAAERERIERDQPGTIQVSCDLLRELARIFEVFAHSDRVPNDLSQQAAAALIATRATLAGGEA